jgi:hypothetical protein
MPARHRDVALRYDHARSLHHVRHGIVGPVRKTDVLPAPACAADDRCDRFDEWHDALHMEAAYAWLAREVGFWPLFLAVGESDDDRRMTGYQNQWSRSPYWAPPGRPRNLVLFSWRQPPAGVVHCCYDHWHIVLNGVRSCGGPHDLRVELDDPRTTSWVMHRSWSQADWLRYGRRWPGQVQAVAPMLDLATADLVWAPSERAARTLEAMGFPRVDVRRLRVAG